MIETCALDSDVIIKIGRLRGGSLLFDATTIRGRAPAIVAVARFACRQRARRWAMSDEAISDAVEDILSTAVLLEPTNGEIESAAALEETALRQGLPLDAGESLLFAIVTERSGLLAVTGDKRAIGAVDRVRESRLDGRIACFEQLLATIVASGRHDALRTAVCLAVDADRSAAICFQCHATSVSQAAILDGLASYIEALRNAAPDTLFPGLDWSTEVA